MSAVLKRLARMLHWQQFDQNSILTLTEGEEQRSFELLNNSGSRWTFRPVTVTKLSPKAFCKRAVRDGMDTRDKTKELGKSCIWCSR